MSPSECPCGSSKAYKSCCEPLIDGDVSAETPEQLMRSRYCAYCVKNIDYLYDTLDPQARGDFDRTSTQEWADTAEFTKLEIINASQDGNKGIVEFKAHFKKGDEETVHHEVSKFRKQAGIWYFRDGKTK